MCRSRGAPPAAKKPHPRAAGSLETAAEPRAPPQDDKIKTTGGAGAPSAAGTPVAAAGGAGVDELVKNLKDKSEQLAKEIKAEIGKN